MVSIYLQSAFDFCLLFWLLGVVLELILCGVQKCPQCIGCIRVVLRVILLL